MITPFSVLDTRTKEWKQRKDHWITTYGIQSELGREDTQSKSQFWESTSNVSIFDPVLCELMYDWFVPKGGKILDPFSGGSVRGIVAHEMGYTYDGIDLSQNQILANKKQSHGPNWILGDADKELFHLDNDYDFVFTCPPYYDLEVYSDDMNDLSTLSERNFDIKFDKILYKSTLQLKQNRFFGIVVSEVRNPSTTGNYSIGNYRKLVSKTIEMCESHGLKFYNDMVLFNSQHQASRVGKTYFDRNRKIPSVHQNILIFVKGNPDIATEEIKGGEFKCQVNDTKYLTFRHAAIDIDPNKLVASEVKRRCISRKSKYKDWQIIGEETRPEIKYVVCDIPFESPQQVSELLDDVHEQQCRNMFESNNPKFRHWKRVEPKDWNLSYKEMEELWDLSDKAGGLHIFSETIQCGDKKYISIHEASKDLNLSGERVRQKIKSEKYKDWIYLDN
ncbi:MAG: class I SAM-dependent methyltransferase [Flavobacteriales bacterium]|nr:class I SAM-dependent methyltransferase [Flavobacteriales bacterium]